MIPVSATLARSVVGDARDGDLMLALDRIYEPDASPWMVSAYRFDMLVRDERAGTISLRIGDDARLVRYAGHVGFSVTEPYLGRHIAERATRLLFPLAKAHGLDPLWIGCNPDNAPSRRTLERLGAELVEVVALPPDYERYYNCGEREKCRYRLDLADAEGRS